MTLPRQVGLKIEYDGTIKQIVSGIVSNTGGSGGTYTVVPGDTLWALAKKYYGNGMKYTEIYNANASLIEATARNHGKSSSSNGHWIWPGETLVIPGIQNDAQTTVKTSGAANSGLGAKIAGHTSGFTYTDVASGQSDSVSVTMHDIDKEWLGKYMPKKGASLGAKLKLTNWNKEERVDTFDCGTFILDDISFSGRPLNCVLGGVSVPIMDDFKSKKRTQTWEKTTVRDIASEIAGRTGVSLYYDAPTIQIPELEQNKQTDSAFLYALCEKYGLAMKVYNHKIVIFDIVAYEAKAAVLTLKETDMLSGWKYNTTVDGTYTGVELNYTDPDTDETINVVMGSSGRMLSENTQATSRYDAELQAAAKVNAANRKIETMDVPIRANIGIVASQCINISGLGNADGKYYIEKIKHSIGSGYKMQLTLHKVQTPIMVTAPVKSAGGSRTYVVKPGDTLWGIAKQFYGSGTKHGIIYGSNTSLIESTATEHGFANSDNGHWIWPGTVLTIPEG